MKEERRIRQAIEYIETHLDEEISLDALARQACLSKYHFHRLFRRATGEPVQQYIRKRRMERAAAALAAAGRPILEIALDCRYTSQEAFSRAFQRFYTLTPGRFRQLFASGKQNVVRMAARTHRVRDLAA